MLGKRRHLRVKGSFKIMWAIQDIGIEGEGIISNLSLNGMELMTKRSFELTKGNVFLLEPLHGEIIPLQSKKARVMWFERMLKDGVDYFQIGLEFIK